MTRQKHLNKCKKKLPLMTETNCYIFEQHIVSFEKQSLFSKTPWVQRCLIFQELFIYICFMNW